MSNHSTISGKTKLLGLLGSPVSHSISPKMHNTAFSYHGIDYVYLCFDVDTTTLKDAVAAAKTFNMRGFNLTMPNKNDVHLYLDHISDAAKLSGSVNTVVNENGILYGHNTDGMGYFEALKELSYDVKGQIITVLGDGGASRAICSQAALNGADTIYIVCLDPFKEASKTFADKIMEFTSCKVVLKDIEVKEDLDSAVLASSLVVNATSVGMGENNTQTLIEDFTIYSNKPLVSDVIYLPKETEFLKRARLAGLKTCNGLGMLLYQGAHAFKLWTGEDMPIDVVKKNCFPELI
ncbi:MAG: shikimate dehydrogenase [Lachnospiraceae bacterium]|nr:shikimate dehydrogenase [Lachnospiraceae bacterium]